MTYKHLTIDELTMIESYYLQHNKPVEIANRMGRAIQTIYNVVNKFKQGKTVRHQLFKEALSRCFFVPKFLKIEPYTSFTLKRKSLLVGRLTSLSGEKKGLFHAV
ncbi:hypothetical protein EfmAA290_02930 [Enterococcus faecium]|nr:hypothetical protein EfmAA290_02930 [Enterococcus faecium]